MAQEMNLWTRLQSESPKFFKKVMNYAISLAVSAAAVLAIPATTSIVLPNWLELICQNIIVAGTVAAAIAKTTICDAPSLPKPAAPKDAEQQNNKA